MLLADDLAPADTAGLDPATTIALVTRLGGPTSHTAIIARQLGIPCVRRRARTRRDRRGHTGSPVDGTAGEVVVAPDAAEGAGEGHEHIDVAPRGSPGWTGPGRTADGVEVAVLANVADGASARAAYGASRRRGGPVPHRTSLSRDAPRARGRPVDDQAAIYREVFDAFAGRKVVVRTLKRRLGKPLRFVDHPDEANPALGVRGDRIALAHPGDP